MYSFSIGISWGSSLCEANGLQIPIQGLKATIKELTGQLQGLEISMAIPNTTHYTCRVESGINTEMSTAWSTSAWSATGKALNNAITNNS